MSPNKIEIYKKQISSKYNIDSIVADGQLEKAKSILGQLLESLAKSGKFREASILKDWLIELDPLDITGGINAAEIIDKAKIDLINPKHLGIWRNLTQSLSKEEFASLYHAMQMKLYPNNSKIVKQGTYFPALLFINEGKLQLSTFADGKNIILKSVGVGEIVGGSSFFDPSNWTITVISMASEVSVLSFSALQSLEKEHPGLESKLFDFCRYFPDPDNALKSSIRGRRAFIRSRLEGKTAIQLLNQDGSVTSSGVRGYLYDISKGGVSCIIRLSLKNNAIKLFGRKIQASLPLHGTLQPYVKNGKVVAVKGYHAPTNEYSLHVQFEQNLNDSDLNRIVMAGKA